MSREQGDGTVGKALDVLNRVAEAGRPVRFTELLGQGGYPKATLHRLLQTLTSQGMLQFDPQTQAYFPGLRLVRFAHAAWARSSLAPIARPWLDRLSAELGQTLHLAQLDQGQVLYVDKRNAARPVDMFSEAGKVGPAYCTGVGKALLAFLPEDLLQEALSRQSFHAFTQATLTSRETLLAALQDVRRMGYALDREEHEPGIICIAVPVLSSSGRAIGALSVTSSTQRGTIAGLESLAPRLTEAARDIAAEAAAWRFPEA